MVLILSGNLAFLNWLTALPAVMCFDDSAMSFLFFQKQVDNAMQAEVNYRLATYLCIFLFCISDNFAFCGD